MIDYKLHNDCKAISAAEYKNSKIKAPADWKRIKTKSNVLREFTDLFKNVLVKGMTLAESLDDSAGDQEANRYGREQGKNHPEVETSVLVDKYRPNGLPERY